MIIMPRGRVGACLLAVVFALTLSLWPAARHSFAAGDASTIAALPGFTVSVWANGTAAYSNPDSILTDGKHVYVGYQNVTAKDGSDNKTSTVVEYTMSGRVVRTFSALGHCDGLRMDPTTHLLWALTDEDGNPHLVTMDPASGATQLYKFPNPPHGGGYDDMAFVNDMALMDASNPNLDKNGTNVFPALDRVTLSNGMVHLTPVLAGNAPAIDITANANKKVTLNLIDPDSMTFDPQGNLVLDDQGGTQLVFINGVGTTHQYVSALTIGDAMDDTAFATATAGTFLLSDTKANAIYALHSTTLLEGAAYATAPNDSGVAGFVGNIDLNTGIVTPVAIGFLSPHGMLFMPSAH